MTLLSRSVRRMSKIVILILLGVQSLPPALAFVRDEDFTTRRSPVNEAVLDTMRGGFQRGPDGPFMSFGIERNVFLDGELVSSTVLTIQDMKRYSDLRRFDPFVGRSDTKHFANHPSDTFTLIQSGPGNSLPPNLSALPPFTTVIQNSLDNRTIQTETVINATVEALTWTRSLHLGNALSQASIEAIHH